MIKSVGIKNSSKSSGKGGSKGEKPLKTLPTQFRLSNKIYFLTYKGISDSGQRLTKEILGNYLLHQNPNDRKLRPEKYLICQQMYDSGEPHLHAILIYPKRKEITSPYYYDYLGIHPNIQTMRNMKAALNYIYKQDPDPSTNLDVGQQFRKARAKDTSSLYQLLEEQMMKDPFYFDVDQYCAKYNLFKQIYKANYAKAITLIKRAQPAYARALLAAKPGIKFITSALISQRLNESELKQFYSHSCYQKIVDHINQIVTYPNFDWASMAPLKTKHLLLVGQPDTGKTSLVYHRANDAHPYPGLAYYYATYYMAVGQKFFPPYKSFDYRLVNWQQFTINSDMFPKKSYNRLLNYLDGSVSALPQKGRPAVERQDNPKHILTSNLTLKEHILNTFNSPQSREKASLNLPARIDCVLIPKGKNIHFLRKLFVSNELTKFGEYKPRTNPAFTPL